MNLTIDQWRNWCNQRHDQGIWILDTMTLVDHGEFFHLVSHWVCHEPWERELVICEVPSAAPIPTIADLFPSADWCEREMAEMFGVHVTGRERTELLLLHEQPTVPPLLRSNWLEPRITTQWPGSHEPGDDGRQGANPARRRTMPLGVPK